VEIKHQQPRAGLLLAWQNFICCEKKLVLYQILCCCLAEITFVYQFSTFSISFRIQKTDFLKAGLTLSFLNLFRHTLSEYYAVNEKS